MAFKMNGWNAGMGTGSANSMYKKDPGSTVTKSKPVKDTTTNPSDGSKVKSMYKKDEEIAYGGTKTWSEGQKTSEKLGGSLNDWVKERAKHEKGSAEYNKLQNKINQALGSKKRHSTDSKDESGTKQTHKNTTTAGTEKDKVVTNDEKGKDKNVTTYYPSGEKKKDKVVVTDADGNKSKKMIKYNKDGTIKKERGYDYTAPGN